MKLLPKRGRVAVMELFGIHGRWRRPPYVSLTDEQMDQLKAAHQAIGLM